MEERRCGELKHDVIAGVCCTKLTMMLTGEARGPCGSVSLVIGSGTHTANPVTIIISRMAGDGGRGECR